MTIEKSIVSLIGPIVSGRFYPDAPPDTQIFPYALYQQIGGNSLWHLEGVVGARNGRIQITIWANTRQEANTIALAVEKALAESNMTVNPYGAFTAIYDTTLKKSGTRQDFGIWA